MTRTEALDVAMFAVNTLLSPDGSSDSDLAVFTNDADEALRVLEQIRDGQMG